MNKQRGGQLRLVTVTQLVLVTLGLLYLSILF